MVNLVGKNVACFVLFFNIDGPKPIESSVNTHIPSRRVIVLPRGIRLQAKVRSSLASVPMLMGTH